VGGDILTAVAELTWSPANAASPIRAFQGLAFVAYCRKTRGPRLALVEGAELKYE